MAATAPRATSGWLSSGRWASRPSSGRDGDHRSSEHPPSPDTGRKAEPPMSDYHDPRIECTDDALLIHGYYFPWGTKRIPYTAIHSLDRFTLSLRNGKGRIWGSGDFKHWANFDAGRPKKDVGFRLDVGGRIIPWV